MYQEYGIWPAPLLEALRSTMVLQSGQAVRYLYVPRPGATCQSS
jgi:hypothetical protein